MRIKEIVSESVLRGASTKSWPTYLTNILAVPTLALGDSGSKAKDLILTDQSRENVKSLLAQLKSLMAAGNEKNTKALVKTIEETELDFKDGTTAPIKQIFKSPEIKSGPADVKTGARTTKYWNDGEVAETFLGVALFARFQSDGPISAKEVLSAMQELSPAVGGFSAVGSRNDNGIEVLAINKPANNQVIDEINKDIEGFKKQYPKHATALLSLLDSCADYVNNSPRVIEAIKRTDTEPNADKVIIKTDGVSDQTGTKADLTLKVGDFERLLSLKVNAIKQFGQDSGADGEKIKTFFSRFIPDVDISEILTKWPDMSTRAVKSYKQQGSALDMFRKVYGLIGQAYSKASAILQKKLETAEGAEALVEDLYRGIIHHAQGSETKQVLVILKPDAKRAWAELEFGENLKQSLASFRLEVKLTSAGAGSDNHMIQVYGRPKDSKAVAAMNNKIDTPQQAVKAVQTAVKKRQPVDPELLFQLRSYIQEAGPTMRNIVEMGPLLKSITEVQEINDATPAATTPQPAPAPKSTVTTQPQPVSQQPTQEPAQEPQPMTGKNVTTLKGGTFSQAPDELDIIKKNAGIRV